MGYIEYELMRSKRQSISIQVKANGSVVVHAPLKTPEGTIDDFVIEKSDWIMRHVSEARSRMAGRENVELLTNEEIDRLKRQARVELRNLVWEYAPKIGVGYNRITIRAQKSRWGSCSSSGNLNFNCLLMLAPLEVRQYVVVHELCHRIEMNHSKSFWELVEKVLPDYKKSRKWLKEHGAQLIERLPD